MLLRIQLLFVYIDLQGVDFVYHMVKGAAGDLQFCGGGAFLDPVFPVPFLDVLHALYQREQGLGDDMVYLVQQEEEEQQDQ